MLRSGRARSAGGADSAFEDWVRPHWSVMRRVAERLAGARHRDDVLQEALAAAWRSRRRFDPAKGTERAWLLAITANHARKAVRREPRDEPLEDVPAESVDPDRVDLERAIARLPERQRVAVELCYFADLQVSEVAVVMGCAEGTVKSTLAAARARLRTILGEDYR